MALTDSDRRVFGSSALILAFVSVLLAFAALVAAFLTIILVNRSWSVSLWRMLAAPNRALWWVAGLTAVLLGLVLGLPMLQRLFSFGPVRVRDLALSVAAGVGGLLWFEVLKARRQRAAA